MVGLETAHPDGSPRPRWISEEREALQELIGIGLLRHAMTQRIFGEPRKGVVAHTTASKNHCKNRLVTRTERNGD